MSRSARLRGTGLAATRATSSSQLPMTPPRSGQCRVAGKPEHRPPDQAGTTRWARPDAAVSMDIPSAGVSQPRCSESTAGEDACQGVWGHLQGRFITRACQKGNAPMPARQPRKVGSPHLGGARQRRVMKRPEGVNRGTRPTDPVPIPLCFPVAASAAPAGHTDYGAEEEPAARAAALASSSQRWFRRSPPCSSGLWPRTHCHVPRRSPAYLTAPPQLSWTRQPRVVGSRNR